ncbi:MAG: flippase-like domain-containing protein [Clostridia bacterium]|nr:flippase-like domain-containing protein [Clostridia bacterium]
MDKTNEPIYNKIEVNGDGEPKVVSVSASDIPETNIDKDTKTVETKNKKPSQRVIMNEFFGIDNNKPVEKHKKVFKTVVYCLFIAFVIGVLVYTAIDDFFGNREASAELPEIGDILLANWYYIFFAFFSLFIFMVARGFQRAFVSKTIVGRFYLKTSFASGFIGQMYNYITPLAAGGQPFEITYYKKNTHISAGQSTSIVIATYLINQMAFITVGLSALILYRFDILGFSELHIPDLLSSAILSLAIIGLILSAIIPIALAVFSLFPRVGGSIATCITIIGTKLKLIKDPKKFKYSFLKNVYINSRGLKTIFSHPSILIANFLLSLMEQLAIVSVAYFTLRSFGFDWNSWNIWEWSQVVVVCTIINCAVSFIPTPGSSGAADLSFYAFFAKNLSGGLAFPTMILWRIISYYLVILLGFILLRRNIKKIK